MADIFNNKPGIVAVLDTGNGDDNPFRVTIDDFPVDGSQDGVIITELAIQRHGNFQFLHTLKDLVYVYSFGERIGQIRASGLVFARLCNGNEGLKTILDYYESHRLENRAKPISIAIGTADSGRFRGFLTELNFDVARPEARLAQFGMQFHTLPTVKVPITGTGLSNEPPTGGMGGGPVGGLGTVGGFG